VLIHGAGGSIRTWQYQTEAFRPYYRLLLLDLRDHGNSQNVMPALETYSLKAISRDITQVLDHHGIRQANFVTLSMGAFLMQYLMLHQPQRINRSVLAGAVILGNWKIRGFTKFALLFNRILPYRVMYTTFSWLLMPKPSHQRSRAIYLKQAEKITPEAYMRWVGLYNEFFSTLKRFADWQIPKPTLLAMGKSDYVFLSSAKTLARQQPNAHLAVIPHSGHICNIDNAEEFNRVVLDFLGAME
jgi:pimeloyl-ACP methyl ester carboxylesterase